MFDLAKNKKLWARVRTDDAYARHCKEIKNQYDECFRVAPRSRSAKEILGNNDHATFFRSLRQLQSSALMALIYPDDEEYFDRLVDVVWAYCDDYSWAPLGHYNEYYNRTPADYDVGLIDIFAASVAFSMAEIKSLFYDRFPKLLKDRITAEIRRRTIEPYCTRKYFWEKHDNNWTAVCAGAVGGVLMYEAPDIFMEQKDRLHATMEAYLASYADDAMCVEGAAYWGFGFGFFVSYALLEKEFTHGECDWFKRDKVKGIATYIQKMFLQKDVIAMFSDCNINEGYWIGLPHLLRDIYPDVVEKLPGGRGTIVAYAHFCFSLRSVVYYNPEYVCDTLRNAVYSADKSAYFVKRTDKYGFAAKGGNNGESHNHNDVGSFILARNNRQILCDLGYIGPTSCKGYHDHGKKRYTYFNPSSFSHNLPYFNGIGQDGIRRDDVYAEYDQRNSTLYMNFTNGYGLEYLKSAERTFELFEDRITMCDTFVVSEPTEITERFVAIIEPKIEGNTVIIDDVRMASEGGIKPGIVRQEYVAQIPVNGSYNQIAYCIEYVLPKGVTSFKVTFATP